MTPRSQRLKPLLKLASRKQESAVKVLAGSQQELKLFEDKLQQMKQYREEYQVNAVSSRISPGLLRDKQNFLQQIDQAVELLQEQIKQQKIRIAKDQTDWMQAKQKTDIYDKVIDKIQQTEKMISDERERRELEDRVCRSIVND